jgi:ketosteroid isomerase-like protein
VPWIPELFSAPALARVWEKEERRKRLSVIPFYAGLMTGEINALVESFAGVPEVHHPVRGRIRGVAAFERFADETNAWLAERGVSVADVAFLVAPERGIEETVLRLDGDEGPIELPTAIASDHDERGRIVEQRIYFSRWPLTGAHAIRAPLLQPDAGAGAPDVVAAYYRALADGDVDAVMALFEPDGYVRDPAGRAHHGTADLRALYERFFSNGGGIALEPCAVTDDGHACALEYNLVAWGRTAMAPEAGIAVHDRSAAGRLAAVRVYDDADPRVRGSAPLAVPRTSSTL